LGQTTRAMPVASSARQKYLNYLPESLRRQRLLLLPRVDLPAYCNP
jgi:hypothetical protein